MFGPPVRLHDDKQTYTGVHARGGPDAVPKGYGHVPGTGSFTLGTGSLSLGRKDSLPGRRPSLSRTSSGAACPLPNLLASAPEKTPIERKLSRSSSTGFARPQALEKAATISRREAGHSPCPSCRGVACLGFCRQGCGLLENVFDAYCTPGQSVTWQLVSLVPLEAMGGTHGNGSQNSCGLQLWSSGDGWQMLCEVDER
eukprot:Skav212038  [mRNA]  locus=scaffold782:68834:76341:+ [translate_table: standard]